MGSMASTAVQASRAVQANTDDFIGTPQLRSQCLSISLIVNALDEINLSQTISN